MILGFDTSSLEIHWNRSLLRRQLLFQFFASADSAKSSSQFHFVGFFLDVVNRHVDFSVVALVRVKRLIKVLLLFDFYVCLLELFPFLLFLLRSDPLKGPFPILLSFLVSINYEFWVHHPPWFHLFNVSCQDWPLHVHVLVGVKQLWKVCFYLNVLDGHSSYLCCGLSKSIKSC